MFGQTQQHLKIEVVAPVPTFDGTSGQRQHGVLHDARGVEKFHAADAVALRAGTGGVVEGKQARFQQVQRVVADRAGKARGKQLLFAAVHVAHNHAPVAVRDGGFQRFGNAPARVGAHAQAVDDQFQRVAAVFFQRGQGIEFHDLTIKAHARKALRGQ